jgi:hypothetical protein
VRSTRKGKWIEVQDASIEGYAPAQFLGGKIMKSRVSFGCAGVAVVVMVFSALMPATAAVPRTLATTASSSGAKITAIYFNSPGSDRGGNTSLNGEWVRIKNYTATRKTLTGWTLWDKQNHRYTFPRFSIAAGASVRVHTGSGTNTASNLYWRNGGYVWNNTGDTAYLRNAAGTLRDTCTYTSARDPEVFC